MAKAPQVERDPNEINILIRYIPLQRFLVETTVDDPIILDGMLTAARKTIDAKAREAQKKASGLEVPTPEEIAALG